MPLNTTLATEQYQRYCYCRDNGHLDFVVKAVKCEEYFAGIQWDPAVLNDLRDQRRPGLTINKVLGTLSNIMGEQIDLRSEIAYKARYGAPSGNADAITKTFRFISDKNQLNWGRSELFADGAITSRGFLDVRMNFDRSITGDVEISNLNPKNVIPDPDASEYDPDKWSDVMVTKWLTADDIEYMYNKSDADALRVKTNSSFAVGYDSIDRIRDRFAGSGVLSVYSEADMSGVARMIRIIERQYKKLSRMKFFINLKTGDKQEVPLSWDRNKISLMVENSQGLLVVDESVGQRIRWTVTADDYVLHDDWSPYKHFTVVPYFPYFRYGRTIGFVENLLDPQDLLNKTTSQELHVVNTTANSGWVIKRNNLVNMSTDELEQYGAKTGLVLEVEDINQVDKIQPNQIPQGLAELSRKGENYIKSVSMRGDAQTGMARADVSADQIDAQNQYGDVGLRKGLDNLARSDFILARNVLDMVQEFYTDPRIMNITHNNLTGEQEQVSINWPDVESGELQNDVTLGEYDAVVVMQPAKQTLEQSQFDQGAYMREKLGIAIPDEFIVENSMLMNKTGLVAALKEQKQGSEAQAKKQMEVMGAKLQLAELKAEIAREEGDAVLKRAKAMHTLAQTQEIAGQDPTKDAEMQLEREKADQEMQIEREKHEQKMQLEREKAALQAQLDQQAAAEENRLKRAQAILTMRQSEQDPAGKPKAEAK